MRILIINFWYRIWDRIKRIFVKLKILCILDVVEYFWITWWLALIYLVKFFFNIFVDIIQIGYCTHHAIGLRTILVWLLIIVMQKIFLLHNLRQRWNPANPLVLWIWALSFVCSVAGWKTAIFTKNFYVSISILTWNLICRWSGLLLNTGIFNGLNARKLVLWLAMLISLIAF